MPTVAICLNNMYLKTLSSEGVCFLKRRIYIFSSFSVFIVVAIIFAVAFVNGMTDAPNAIVSCVSTKSISLKKAVIIAAISDFAGSVSIGMFNGNVTETVINIAKLGDDKQTAAVGLAASMFSVVLWAVAAWRFGIPTSESHALIAALAGAGFAINKEFDKIDFFAWRKVIYGLAVSIFLGFAAGYVISKITAELSEFCNKEKRNFIFEKSQVLSGALMSFMHGAQDSQKFNAVLMIALSLTDFYTNKKSPIWLFVLCPVFISAGTFAGGERIIKTIGTDMIKMRSDQGFSADIAGVFCLLCSTLAGMPVSTTHTKTSAVIGVGIAEDFKALNWRIAGEMMMAWIITFPVCGFLGWFFTYLFIRIF